MTISVMRVRGPLSCFYRCPLSWTMVKRRWLIYKFSMKHNLYAAQVLLFLNEATCFIENTSSWVLERSWLWSMVRGKGQFSTFSIWQSVMQLKSSFYKGWYLFSRKDWTKCFDRLSRFSRRALKCSLLHLVVHRQRISNCTLGQRYNWMVQSVLASLCVGKSSTDSFHDRTASTVFIASDNLCWNESLN